MEKQLLRSEQQWVVVGWTATYAALTATDAASTLLALRSGRGREANPHVACGEQGLDLERFLWINGLLFLFLLGMLIWSILSRHRVDPVYRERPLQAFWNWLYLNPFSDRNTPKAAFQYLAVALLALGFKLLGTGNNLLIASGLQDLLTPVAGVVFRWVPGTPGYWLLIFLLFLPLWWVSLVCAGFLSRRWHAEDMGLAMRAP